MGGRRRYLVIDEICAVQQPEAAAEVAARFAACPEAAAYTDEEAEDFMSAAHYLDSINREGIVRSLQNARIPFPPELSFDEYRLCRYLLRRWRDPAIREPFLENGLLLDYRGLAALKRTGDIGPVLRSGDRECTPALCSMIRRSGMGDLLPSLEAALSPEQAARHQTLLQIGKLLLHRFLTERELPVQPSRWEQRKVARRIRLRDVQMHAMHRSLRKLRLEHRVLLGRIGQIGLGDQPELDRLATELTQIREERQTADRLHAAAVAEQSARYQASMAQLQTELAAALQDYRATLALRAAWLPTKGGESDAAGLAVHASRRRAGHSARDR